MENKDKNIELIKQALLNIQDNISKVLQLLNKLNDNEDVPEEISRDIAEIEKEVAEISAESAAVGEKIVEGMFDGQTMIGPDGKQYSAPANYASKSKLVEGDILKLTISPTGGFIYKQIGPVERDRVVGILKSIENEFYAEANGQNWKLLKASVTYYKGGEGDEIVFLIPKEKSSRWAAVENIIRKSVTETIA